jgi:biotin carboxylase
MSQFSSTQLPAPPRPFKKVMSCNRGEISIRFARAGAELGLKTVAVYSKEDRHSLHRYKADQVTCVPLFTKLVLCSGSRSSSHVMRVLCRRRETNRRS